MCLRLVVPPVGIEVALLETERHGRGGRLVDDVQHLETGHVAGVLRGLAADFVEVGRNGNHRLVDRADLLLGVERGAC